MKTIPLTKGAVALVDDDDFEWLNQWKWHLSRFGYAVRKPKEQIYMHRLVAKTPVGMKTDHINYNKLDNRKCNLRICTDAQNARNRPKQSNNTSGYKGVFLSKKTNRWRAQIRLNKKTFHLGTFETREEAYKKYKEVEKEYFGEYTYE